MKFFSFLFLFCFFILSVYGQNKYTISGYVKDAETGESLIGANVFIKEIQKGTASNLYGFYSLTLEEGKYTLVFQYLGYTQQEFFIELNKSTELNIGGKIEVQQQEEIVITGERSKENIENTEMGKIELDVKQIKSLPALMGEVDLLKTLQLMPGVKSAGEGNTGLYVRGGGADQNLILLDEAVVYNSGHLFGFFSVFNSDAIKSVTLHKGNMPANYGGRLSSVVDFAMKEGNNKTFHAQGGIGLIASRLTLEGPIVKGKGSFIISGRRTYVDAITKGVHEAFPKVTFLPYYFYDFNAKANYTFSKNNRLYFSSYIGKDQMTLNFADGRFKSDISWGNKTATLRWNHLFSEKLFLNLSLIYNTYLFSAHTTYDQFSSKVDSKILDYSLKMDFDYYPAINHKIKYGVNYIFHTFTPRHTQANAGAVSFNQNAQDPNKYAHEVGVYLMDDIDLTEKFRLSAGVRLNAFQQVGPYNFITSHDTLHFNKGEAVKTFINPEPRLGLRYALNQKSSLKAGFNLNNQYIHLVSLSGNSLPFDIWVPSSRIIKPQRGTQYSVGYFRNIKDNNYEFSVEAYYKDLYHQIEYRQDYVPTVSGDIEEEFVFGKGQSYGVELFLKKNFGKTQGWIGYTLSKTTRKFPQINDGNTFPARYDKRHDLSVVATHTFSEKWTFGATFVFSSGQPITLPERAYIIGGNIYNQYSQRNAYRMQPYNRLDLSATYTKKRPAQKYESSWTFAVYNAYNRKNPFIYYIDADGSLAQNNIQVKAKKLYLFPIIPSITWNFKF